MSDTSNRFDPLASLPVGMLSIEASAGTGKTYTLSGLATRFLATGEIAAADLLLVTFTRAATGELRSRVRSRVAESAAHLDAVLAGTVASADTSDELFTWLTTADAAGRVGDGPAPRAVLEARHDNLVRALAEFDAATITTIHGFAAQVLTALGVSTGVATDITFVEDADQLLVEACSDVLARAAVDPTITSDLPTWTTFHMRVKGAMASVDIVVAPAADDETAKPNEVLLAELVRQAVALMRTRRAESGTQSFDDLLSRLRDAIAADHAGAAAAVRGLRGRYRVALIDEFQDTDPVQWEIFRTLFAPTADAATPAGSGDDPTDDGVLVLVGDPKQAIYSFRGADVTTYVAAIAATPSDGRRTLATNWRSDRALLTATGTLFDGVTFGPGIAFSRVDAPGHAADHSLYRSASTDPTASADPVTAVEIRCGTSPDLCNDKDEIDTDTARAAAIGDLVEHTVDLLENCVLPDSRPGAPTARRHVRPSDIAVLVRANSHAEDVQSALLARGIPAVLARGKSVAESPAADQLRFLLEALVRPSDPRRARTFAMSWFGGWTPATLASATDPEMVEVQEQLHQWNALLTSRGVVEFLRAVWDQSGVVPRVLGRPDGDRSVTDLEHLGELLRLAVGDAPVSAAGLLGALDDLAARVEVQADTDRDTDISSRRVESDADAVQIMTVWVAKGLEFPIVMCPTLWSRPPAGLDYHDPETGQRVVDVRAPSKLPVAVKRQQGKWAAEESAAEDMRLLYVALTRAKHHTAVWWVDSGRSCSKSALAKVLFARNPDTGAIVPEFLARNDLKGDKDDVNPMPDRADTVARLQVLHDLSGGTIAVRSHGRAASPPPSWTDPEETADKPPLAASEFTRGSRQPLDRSRSRWSFTAVVARDNTHGDPWDLTIDDEGADDEQRPPDVGLPDSPLEGVGAVGGAGPGEPTPSGADTPETGANESPLAWLPAGAAFGTITHDVFERVDFTTEDLPAEVAAVVAEQQRWRSLSLRPVGRTVPSDSPDEVAAAEEEGATLLTAGIVTAIHTPLGPLFRTADGTERTLRHIAPADRLDEMSFELNLAPGHAGTAPTDADLGAVLLAHLPADDPFRPWAQHLAGGVFGVDLAGHLTGSIDAVIRLREPDNGADSGTPDRFVVVDYKTNRLHPYGEAPSRGDYGAVSMRRSMVEHHYPLQALLYSVALHRYLRWRLPGYDPAVHLGGAAYLFVRGMTGPAVRTETLGNTGGHPDGVCSWAVPPAAVVAVSDLLAGQTPSVASGR